MFGIGMPELMIILVIILIIFGAGKLPEIGGAIGKGIKNFKKSFNEQDELNTTGESKKIEGNNQKP
jgi:sec-independent protein translocase protein TatA